ncbi:hypothetical protein C8F04DRAFT_1240871 [Mycena alexandri]|uniref:Uncharacterized protein n=1 Tax=Mycena alexandri TaxID=1745969 RepID=A0AAD6WV90_9AGAR|nr:hypothetical protein C8F04DRAFT_1240871 [Mycena alexandri]
MLWSWHLEKHKAGAFLLKSTRPPPFQSSHRLLLLSVLNPTASKTPNLKTLRKRKRPAEDEGGGRELVDGAADDVLATRRGRRTESSEAREKREVMMAQLGKRKRQKQAE